MKRACLSAIVLLSLPLAATRAQAPDEPARRAAVLVYRQALNPRGPALAATAGVLTEQADGGGDLDQLRERVLAALGDVQGPLPPHAAGAPSDAVAALLSHAVGGGARADGMPPLGPGWSLMDGNDALRGLAPVLLGRAREHDGVIWRRALTAAADDESLAHALAPLLSELAGAPADASLAEWLAVKPALAAGDLSLPAAGRWGAGLTDALRAAARRAGGEPPVELARWRAQWVLLQARDTTLDADRRALYNLELAALGRLGEQDAGNPLPFMSALVSGAQALAAAGPLGEGVRRDLGKALAPLESLPMRHDAQWREVDQRLPELFAETMDRLETLIEPHDAQVAQSTARALTRLQARVSLLAPDWDAYLTQPFREPVQQALEDCFATDSGNRPGNCLQRFAAWATDGAAIPEAAGDIAGPFGAEYVLRELELNPWQRINYLRGFWRMLMGRDCSPEAVISNPLEWSLGSRAYLLAAGRSPGKPLPGLDRLIDGGARTATDLGRFADCQSGGATTLGRILDSYSSALDRLAAALPEAARAFREQVLEPGADLSLDGGARQATEYVPAGLTLTPCEGAASCGVAQPLPGSGALYRKFPPVFRIADQSGLGELSLCYTDVSWVDRRMEPRPVGGKVMADYHGRLSFRVKGRYREGGQERDVFVLRMISEKEYPYLIAPDRPEVLADPCPQEYQGRQAFGELPSERAWLVPKRLTFLSTERTPATRLFSENWTRGKNWLERLTDGGAEEEKSPSLGELPARVEQHLAILRQRRGEYLYAHLAAVPALQEGSAPVSGLGEAMQDVTALFKALDASARVLIPRSIALEPVLRSSLYGTEPLMHDSVVHEWRAAGRDPMALADEGRRRFDAVTGAWRAAAAHGELSGVIGETILELVSARAGLAPEPAGDAKPSQ